MRRPRPSERKNHSRNSRHKQQNTTMEPSSQPVLSALYAEAETPLTKNVRMTDDASQHYAEAGGTGHYAETQAFAVTDEPKQTTGVKRGGKYGYSTVNKPGNKKKSSEQASKSSSTLPRHLPSDNVYMPLTEGEYDHLNQPRPKNSIPNENQTKGIKLIPYQQVSLRRKKQPEIPYDVPRSHKKNLNPQETYDVPPSHTSQSSEAQETYDVPPSSSQNHTETQETYDVPGSNTPLNDYDAPRSNVNSAASSQMMYDVPPPSNERPLPGQMMYDRPPLIPTALSGVYDVPKSQKNSPKNSPKSSPKMGNVINK